MAMVPKSSAFGARALEDLEPELPGDRASSARGPSAERGLQLLLGNEFKTATAARKDESFAEECLEHRVDGDGDDGDSTTLYSVSRRRRDRR